ncbi:MAG: sulfatase [Pseudoflavonifractor sp.]|nr:sulfatase [Alloprevotella sp.]MCM1116127.1 sulfatase [Pseudoflavonifractor sp.]
MNKTSALYLAGIAAASAAVASCTAAKAADDAKKPMNIVYIMTDDHTAQMMSAYDTRYISTPNLDRIAADGVKFRNSFVANSLSGPSRACMLTGKHSHANGFVSNETSVFDASQPTWPKYLQEAGYETALVGKWHLETLPQGFNYWEIVPGQGDYWNPRFIKQTGDTVVEPGYLTHMITDKSLHWLDSVHDPSKPFALVIHHKAIHRNWLPDTADLELYEDVTFPLPETFYDDYAGRPAAEAAEMRISSAHDMDLIYDLKMDHPDSTSRLKQTYLAYVGRMDSAQRARFEAFYQPIRDDFFSRNLQGKELAEWKYQRYMRDYAKVVKSLDDNVGRVLDYLKEHDLLDNTLVVYTSDQGFYMGEHGWFDKRFMYEESLNTPLVMLLPKGMDARGDIDEMVQNIDYAPTFMEIAGVEIPEDIQGVSLLPLLKGEHPADWRDAIYYHYHEYPAEHAVKRHYGVRTDRYALMHFYNDIDKWELYDLTTDPNELHNLYGQPGYEEVTKQLMDRLKELQEQYDDPIRHQFPIE